MFLTRIAPTPSGFLHVGNLVNFKLVDWLAKEIKSPIALRIDDIDSERVRPQYVQDIFDKLSALEIAITIGPKQASDLDRYSQNLKISEYWSLLIELQQKSSAIFVCACSRSQRVSGRCVQNCRQQQFQYQPNQNAIRIDLGDRDEVLWRRDDLPAYHLTDIYDDAQLGVTHVVRGADLYESTKLQTHLRGLLGLAIPVYLFHPLLNRNGEKLSKSTGTKFLALSDFELERITEVAGRFIPLLQSQLSSPIQSLTDLSAIDID